MRRILLLITDLEIGGTPTVVRELALRLHQSGKAHVEVACLSKWGPVADQIAAGGVSVTALGACCSLDLRIVPKLINLIREHRIDTVFSFLLHANAVAAAASLRFDDVRFIQSIQTVQAEPRWHWTVQRMVQTAAERIVVPSETVGDVAVQRCSIERRRTCVIHNAINPGEFPRVAVFQRKPVRIGFLGRLDPVKNLPIFVRTVERLAGEDVEGHIFGEGPERAAIEQQIAAGPMRARIVLHGAVARPQDALKEMDVLFFPSTGEGFGLVVLEALASGVPVVAPCAGGICDIVVNEFDGLLYEPSADPIHALRRVIGDADLRSKLIENGLATARDSFTWETVLPKYLRLLQIDNRNSKIKNP